ncbi:hypothetical protein ACFL2H_08600 [Planctomycetota bacterium]
MHPKEFITISGRIAGQGAAGARSAISRAYYGAFHTALLFLEDVDCTLPRNSNQHSLVQHALSNSSIDPAYDAGTLLSDLHGERIKADYRLENTNIETLASAQVAVEMADTISRLVGTLAESLREDPTRLQVFKDEVSDMLARARGR